MQTALQPKSLMRQIRRGNYVILWNPKTKNVEVYRIPRAQRSSFHRNRKNRELLDAAITFMHDPTRDPITGLPHPVYGAYVKKPQSVGGKSLVVEKTNWWDKIKSFFKKLL